MTMCVVAAAAAPGRVAGARGAAGRGGALRHLRGHQPLPRARVALAPAPTPAPAPAPPHQRRQARKLLRICDACVSFQFTNIIPSLVTEREEKLSVATMVT